MAFPQFILDKIKPFTDSFGKDLKSRLDAVDRELSPQGLIDSGAQIKRHQDEFLGLLSELINKISEIVINDIRNKSLTKPELSAARATIEQLVLPLINRAKVGLDSEIRRLIPKAESADHVIADFDSELHGQLNQWFADIEQKFDAV